MVTENVLSGVALAFASEVGVAGAEQGHVLTLAIALWHWGGHGRGGAKDSGGKPVERETSTWVMLEAGQSTVCKADTQATLRPYLHLCVPTSYLEAN